MQVRIAYTFTLNTSNVHLSSTCMLKYMYFMLDIMYRNMFITYHFQAKRTIIMYCVNSKKKHVQLVANVSTVYDGNHEFPPH